MTLGRVEAQWHASRPHMIGGDVASRLFSTSNRQPTSQPPILTFDFTLHFSRIIVVPAILTMSKLWEVDPETRSKVRYPITAGS